MTLLSYNLDHTQTTNKGTVATYKFTCVVQTSSKKVEKYVKEKWPKLMTYAEYSAADRLEMFKMKDYLKANITQSDIDEVHELAYARSWFTPFYRNDKITKCVLTEFGAKTWSNPDVPYLELSGTITLDLKDLITFYIKQKWIIFETKSGIMSEAPAISFIKPLPFAMIYNGSSTPFEIILKEIIVQASKQNSDICKLLSKTTKLKNIHSYDKEILWSMDRKKILIKLKNTVRLLKDKALAEPIKYGLMGLAAHEFTKDMKPSTKAALGLGAYLWLK